MWCWKTIRIPPFNEEKEKQRAKNEYLTTVSKSSTKSTFLFNIEQTIFKVWIRRCGSHIFHLFYEHLVGLVRSMNIFVEMLTTNHTKRCTGHYILLNMCCRRVHFLNTQRKKKLPLLVKRYIRHDLFETTVNATQHQSHLASLNSVVTPNQFLR